VQRRRIVVVRGGSNASLGTLARTSSRPSRRDQDNSGCLIGFKRGNQASGACAYHQYIAPCDLQLRGSASHQPRSCVADAAVIKEESQRTKDPPPREAHDRTRIVAPLA
jgi:hypothetical protein